MSDLADALRNLDDTRKQKNDAARELKELKCVFLYLKKKHSLARNLPLPAVSQCYTTTLFSSLGIVWATARFKQQHILCFVAEKSWRTS